MAAEAVGGQIWVPWAIWGLAVTATILAVVVVYLCRDHASDKHASPYWLWTLATYVLFVVNVKGCEALLGRYGESEAATGDVLVPEVKLGDWVFNLVVFVAPVILFLGTLISVYYRKKAEREAIAERRWLQGTGPRPPRRAKRRRR